MKKSCGKSLRLKRIKASKPHLYFTFPSYCTKCLIVAITKYTTFMLSGTSSDIKQVYSSGNAFCRWPVQIPGRTGLPWELSYRPQSRQANER